MWYSASFTLGLCAMPLSEPVIYLVLGLIRGCLRSSLIPSTPVSSALIGSFPNTPRLLRFRKGTRSPWPTAGFGLATQRFAPPPIVGVAPETRWVERATLALLVPTPA